MNDQEKIEKAAREFVINGPFEHKGYVRDAFKAGVAWRDENPKEHDCPNHHLYPVEQCVVCPAEQSGYHRAVDDICEWLQLEENNELILAEMIKNRFGKGDGNE